MAPVGGKVNAIRNFRNMELGISNAAGLEPAN